jgi:hypothetical protein
MHHRSALLLNVLLLATITTVATVATRDGQGQARAAASTPSSQPSSIDEEAPKRSKTTCARLRHKLDRTARATGLEDRIVANSWGTIPSGLRDLPPGAELCGVDDTLGHAVISSSLYGSHLQSHYAPLFARFGCQPLSCNIIVARPGIPDQTRCRCSGPSGIVGIVNTDPKNEAYTVTIALARPGE